MNEEMLDLLLQYIDTKIQDEVFNHKVAEHGGCYYAYSDDARKVREKLVNLIRS